MLIKKKSHTNTLIMSYAYNCITKLQNKTVEKKKKWRILKLIFSLLQHDLNLANGMMCYFYLFGSNSLAKSESSIKSVPELPLSISILNS